MSDKLTIEELLKKELGQMAPEPPAGAWESISSQVQLVAQAGQVAAATSAKSALVSTKLILVSAIAVTSVAGLVGYTLWEGNKKEAVKEKETISVETGPVRPQHETVPVPQPDPAASSPGNEVPAPGGELQDRPSLKSNAGNPAPKAKTPAGPKAVSPDQPNKPHAAQDEPQEPPVQPRHQDKEEVPAGGNEDIAPDLPDPGKGVTDPEPVLPEIPNVFTPNGDGRNDEFVISIENEQVYDLKIVNRNGVPVFESRDKQIHWKGTDMNNGLPCEDGWYQMTFRYQVKGMKEPRVINELIRLKRN